jgi:hypothetical protein
MTTEVMRCRAPEHRLDEPRQVIPQQRISPTQAVQRLPLGGSILHTSAIRLGGGLPTFQPATDDAIAQVGVVAWSFFVLSTTYYWPMPLLSFWNSNRDEVLKMTVQHVVSSAGDGQFANPVENPRSSGERAPLERGNDPHHAMGVRVSLARQSWYPFARAD